MLLATPFTQLRNSCFYCTSWANDHTDPSVSLSPYTVERLKIAYSTGLLELVNDTCVEEVKRVKDGYAVYGEYNKWMSPTPPILCTGFIGSLNLIADLFSWQDGQGLLTAQDESTRTPGLFVVGPSVRHGQVIFCFIYKFRQRFAVVAEAIAYRMGLDTSPRVS